MRNALGFLLTVLFAMPQVAYAMAKPGQSDAPGKQPPRKAASARGTSLQPRPYDFRIRQLSNNFLRDLIERVQIGTHGNLRSELASHMQGVPDFYRPLVSRLIERSLLAYADQAQIAANYSDARGWIGLPEPSRPSLEDDATEMQKLPSRVESGREHVWRDIREVNAQYMAAHQDARVMNASAAERAAVLKQVRTEALGAQTLAPFERLNGTSWVRLMNRGGEFASDETRPTFVQPERPTSKPIQDWGKHLYGALRDLAGGEVFDKKQKGPPTSGQRATLYRMLNRPADYLAVYTLVDGTFDRVGGDSAALKQQVQAHVRSLPDIDRNRFTLFAELARLSSAQVPKTNQEAQAHDVQLLRALKASLGGDASRLTLHSQSVARSPAWTPAGYTKALVVNASRRFWGGKRVDYKGERLAPWDAD